MLGTADVSEPQSTSQEKIEWLMEDGRWWWPGLGEPVVVVAFENVFDFCAHRTVRGSVRQVGGRE
jgi:hypothetical protein